MNTRVAKSFRSVADWISCWLFGFDFFISYAWDDSKEYARGLWEGLTDEPHRFTCFLDERSYVAGDDLRISPQRALRHTSVFVLLASHNAMNSEDVILEATLFSKAQKSRFGKRKVVVIDPEGAYRDAVIDHPIKRLIGNVLDLRTDIGALDSKPPNEVMDAVARSLQSIRRSVLRARVVTGVGILLGALLVATLIFAIQSERSRQNAVAMLAEALVSAAWSSVEQGLGMRAREQLQACPEHLRHAEWRRIKARLPAPVFTLSHHWWCQQAAEGSATSVFVTSGRDDGIIRWDTSVTPADSIKLADTSCHAFCMDAFNRVVAASPDGTNIVVWRLETAAVVASIQAVPRVDAFALNPDGDRLAWVASNRLFIYSLLKQSLLIDTELNVEANSLAFGGFEHSWLLANGPAGAILVESTSGAIHPHILQGPSLIAEFADRVVTHRDGVFEVRMSPLSEPVVLTNVPAIRMLSLSPRGDFMAIEREEMQIALVAVADGQIIMQSRIPQVNPDYAHAFSPDGRWFACDEGRGIVVLLSLTHSNRAGTVATHETRINSINFSRDSGRIVTASLDGTAKVWKTVDFRNDEFRAIPPDVFDMQFGSIDLSPDGRMVYLLDEASASLMTYNIAADQADKHILPGIVSVKAARHGGTVWCTLSGTNAGVFKFDIVTGSLIKRLEGNGFLCVSRDERIAACISTNGHPAFFDLLSGKMLLEYSEITGPPAHGAVISPDGEYLVLNYDYENIRVLSRSRHSVGRLTLPGTVQNPGFVWSMAVSDNSQLLAAGFAFGDLWLFRLRDGSIMHKLKAFDYHVTGVCFSDDDRRLISLSSSGDLQFWDVRSGRSVATDSELEFDPDKYAHFLMKDEQENMLLSTQNGALRLRRMSDVHY